MATKRVFIQADPVIRLSSNDYDLNEFVYPPIYGESVDSFSNVPLGSKTRSFISKDGKRKIVFYFESIHNKWRIFTQELEPEFADRVLVIGTKYVGRQESWRGAKPPIVSPSQWNRSRN